MKKTVKIILTMLLTLCMVMPMLVMSISAAEGVANKVNWVYDEETNILTLTANGDTATPTDIRAGFGSGFYTAVKEAVIANGSSEIKSLGYGTFQLMTALTKVTMPASVTTVNTQVFNGSGIKEIVVEGNAYIPGAADFSNVGGVLGVANHRTFEKAKIETLILKGGVYSAETPIKTHPEPDHWAKNEKSLGTALKTIMGPMNDQYLRDFAATNGYDYVPYGKIGEGTAWTYDEATKTVTIYGNGTESALDALPSADVELLKDAKYLIVRGDIKSIAADAFAGLTNLTDVIFEGNVPTAENDPFGGITVAFHITHTAVVPETGYWADKTANSYTGEYVGTYTGDAQNNTWKYDVRTKTLTISNTATTGSFHTGTAATGGWDAYKTEIEHIVLSGRFQRITKAAFAGHTALKTFTMPKSVLQIITNAFDDCTSLDTISVTGEAIVPGVANLLHGQVSAGGDWNGIQINTANGNQTFTDTAIKGIILPTGFNLTLVKESLPKNLENVIVKYGDTVTAEAQKAFCDANGYNFNYYGEDASKTFIWMYNEDAKTLSICGTGAVSSISLPIGTDAEKIVIGEGITALSTDVFAGLTALKNVTFEGNAPATEGNPFGGIADLTVTIALDATGFEDTWYGYPVSYPSFEDEGTFIATENGTEEDGAWKFDISTGILYIWSNNTSKPLYLKNLSDNESSFKAFAEGDYSKYVTTVKLSNEDGSVVVNSIDGNNSGFDLVADLGLTEIEKIYFDGNILRRITNMFKGLNKLTTFGKSDTEEGTVDLAKYFIDGGAADGAFSGQDGIKKVTIPVGNIYGLPFDNVNKYSTWSNIPANHFAGMEGLCEVVLNGSTENINNGTVQENYGAYYRGTCMIGANAFDGCTALTSLTIPATAPASVTFQKSNLTVAAYTVNLFDVNTFAGSSIETLYIWNPDAAVTANYNISNVANMTIFCANDGVEATIKADAPEANVYSVFEGEGYSVRYDKKNGLRHIYNFDNTVNAKMDEYTLVEYGAMIVSVYNLGENVLTIDPSTCATTVLGSIKKPVVMNGELVGKLIEYDENGVSQFAITLVNFKAGWTDDVYSRVYAVYEDASGNRFVAYEDISSAINFYDAMVNVCQAGLLKDFVCEDVAVWNVLKTGIVGEETAVNDNVTAMLINDVTGSEGKVLVVRNNNGGVATVEDIAAAKAVLAENAEKVIALNFAPKASAPSES
ncbi:MAG: leucine-rich repeat protein [Clostridia bacterium]|nr:leucine-rich repeat protein [Clostridia bacterium]